MWAWMRPGRIAWPLQSMTVVPSARPPARPTAVILPSRTITSASTMRRAGSIVTTRPPFSSRGRTTLGGDPRPRGARVVRQVEVGPDLVQQLVVRVHAVVNAPRATGLHDNIAERIIETREQDRALLVVRQRHVHGVGVGGEQLDPVALEHGGDLVGVVGHIVERGGLVVGGEGSGRSQPEDEDRRSRDRKSVV